MVKLLVKKEMKNLFRTYFINQKSGKGYSKGKTISFILLFVFLIIIMMGMFAGMGFGLSPLISSGLGWFYFAIMGMLALALGVFGDVFNTYSMLYKAKDNEMLLSLPIPPSRILISRMVVVFLLGLLYESMVFIPAVAVLDQRRLLCGSGFPGPPVSDIGIPFPGNLHYNTDLYTWMAGGSPFH